MGVTGEKDGYLYFNGKRLEADDDYRFYVVDEKVYLVNTKGKIQKATGNGKKYDNIENAAFSDKDVTVVTNKSGVVQTADIVATTGTEYDFRSNVAQTYAPVKTSSDVTNAALVKNIMEDKFSDVVSIPFIALYDGVYTYTQTTNTSGGTTVYGMSGTWY